jgi:hypothetical protein
VKKKLITFAFALSTFVLTPLAKADSVVFESHLGNTYTYDIQIDSNIAVFFLDGFTISGLDGVTNATLSGPLASVFDPLGGVSFTSNSVSVGTVFEPDASRNRPPLGRWHGASQAFQLMSSNP